MIQAKPDQLTPIPGPDLVQAAAAGDMAVLATLAQDAAGLKSHGEAALFAACEKGQLAAVQYLAGLGVALTGAYQDVMNATFIKNYPLFIAVGHKKWAVVNWLLQQGVVDSEGHLRWALHKIVEDGALDLFARVIKGIADIGVFLEGGSEYRNFTLACVAVMERDDPAIVTMLRDAGIPAAVLMTKALQCDAVKVTRDLLLDGVALDPVPTAEILQHVPQIGREKDMLNFIRGWTEDVDLSAADLALCRAALKNDPQAVLDGAPVALTLARGGYFSSDIAPLVAAQGTALLLLADASDCTVGDVAARRGELATAFQTASWGGQVAAVQQCIAALPPRLQKQLDVSAITAVIHQQYLKNTRVRGLRL